MSVLDRLKSLIDGTKKDIDKNMAKETVSKPVEPAINSKQTSSEEEIEIKSDSETNSIEETSKVEVSTETEDNSVEVETLEAEESEVEDALDEAEIDDIDEEIEVKEVEVEEAEADVTDEIEDIGDEVDVEEAEADVTDEIDEVEEAEIIEDEADVTDEIGEVEEAEIIEDEAETIEEIPVEEVSVEETPEEVSVEETIEEVPVEEVSLENNEDLNNEDNTSDEEESLDEDNSEENKESDNMTLLKENDIYSMDDIDKEFTQKFIDAGIDTVDHCFQCGTCGGGCPSGRRTPYRVRQIVRKCLLGLREEVISDPALWMCTTCYTCQERCPRSVKIVDIIKMARNEAAHAGYMADAHKATGSFVIKFGHGVPINDKTKALRKEIGLDEVPPTVHSFPEALKEVQNICEACEFDKLIGFNMETGELE